MGIFDEIGTIAGKYAGGDGSGADQSKIAGGLMQAIEQHPGGIGGILQSFQQNGMQDNVNAWTSGQATTATPEQVQQGLNGTGLIERTAEHAGVSPQVVTMAMTTLLPMVMQHFAPGGQTSSQGAFGGLAQQMLGKFL
jgi:uncharacterized protein YidB (DUF937 family)